MTNLQISPQQAAQELINRRAARKRLIPYTEYTKPDFETARHHHLIAQKLEEVEAKVQAGEGARLMIFTPPRHTKSELASRRFPSWVLGRNPHWQIITATYSGDFAADFGRDVRNIVDSPEYRNLFPDVSLRQDSKAANRWNTNAGGIYVAAGAGGPLTGRGGHIILIDDPFKDWQEAYSEAIREARWKWYLTVVRTRLMPGAAIILIMTRWHDDDIAGRLIAQQDKGGDQWEIVSLPALIETELDKANDPLNREMGEAIWPDWFPETELLKTKAVMPAYEWSALYQQKPVPEEGDYFKRDWFGHYDRVPRFKNIYITHDDAVTKDDGDYTEIAVWGIDHKHDVLAINWWSGQKTADVWIDILLDFVEFYKPHTVFGEAGPIRRSIEPFLKKRMEQRKVFCRHEWLPSISDKSSRAQGFRGLASMGKVFFPKNQWATDVIAQLIRFPAGVHDDKVDACSLLGRALDQIWKATLPEPVKKRKPLVAEPITIADLMNEKSPEKGRERY